MGAKIRVDVEANASGATSEMARFASALDQNIAQVTKKAAEMSSVMDRYADVTLSNLLAKQRDMVSSFEQIGMRFGSTQSATNLLGGEISRLADLSKRLGAELDPEFQKIAAHIRETEQAGQIIDKLDDSYAAAAQEIAHVRNELGLIKEADFSAQFAKLSEAMGLLRKEGITSGPAYDAMVARLQKLGQQAQASGLEVAGGLRALNASTQQTGRAFGAVGEAGGKLAGEVGKAAGALNAITPFMGKAKEGAMEMAFEATQLTSTLGSLKSVALGAAGSIGATVGGLIAATVAIYKTADAYVQLRNETALGVQAEAALAEVTPRVSEQMAALAESLHVTVGALEEFTTGTGARGFAAIVEHAAKNPESKIGAAFRELGAAGREAAHGGGIEEVARLLGDSAAAANLYNVTMKKLADGGVNQLRAQSIALGDALKESLIATGNNRLGFDVFGSSIVAVTDRAARLGVVLPKAFTDSAAAAKENAASLDHIAKLMNEQAAGGAARLSNETSRVIAAFQGMHARTGDLGQTIAVFGDDVSGLVERFRAMGREGPTALEDIARSMAVSQAAMATQREEADKLAGFSLPMLAGQADALVTAFRNAETQTGSVKAASVMLRDEVAALVDKYKLLGKTPPSELRVVELTTRLSTQAVAEGYRDMKQVAARNLDEMIQKTKDAAAASVAEMKAWQSQFLTIKQSIDLSGTGETVQLQTNSAEYKKILDQAKSLAKNSDARIAQFGQQLMASIKAGDLGAIEALLKETASQAASLAKGGFGVQGGAEAGMMLKGLVQTMASMLSALRGLQMPEPRAMGGAIFAGQTYLAGEKGPELITAAADGMVHSNGATLGMVKGFADAVGVAVERAVAKMGGGKGGNLNVNIDGKTVASIVDYHLSRHQAKGR